MTSNPAIDAVPHHLRSANPTHHIHKFLSSQEPYLRNFVVSGRAHIDKCIRRDQERRRRKEVAGETLSDGHLASTLEPSVLGTPSQMSTRSSARSSGLVKRMKRKDGSCVIPKPLQKNKTKVKSQIGAESSPVSMVMLKRHEVFATQVRTSGGTKEREEQRKGVASKSNSQPLQEKPVQDKINARISTRIKHAAVEEQHPEKRATRPSHGLATNDKGKRKRKMAVIDDGESTTSSAQRESTCQRFHGCC